MVLSKVVVFCPSFKITSIAKIFILNEKKYVELHRAEVRMETRETFSSSSSSLCHRNSLTTDKCQL